MKITKKQLIFRIFITLVFLVCLVHLIALLGTFFYENLIACKTVTITWFGLLTIFMESSVIYLYIDYYKQNTK